MGADFADLIDIYLKDTLRKLNCLSEALREQDWVILETTAHNLRGSSSNIGAIDVARLALLLEESIQQRSIADVEFLLLQIKDAFEECRIYFKNSNESL